MTMVSSASILRMLDRLEKENVCLHGFELRVGGSVRAEGYYAPFRKGGMHRMYSVSKTFTSAAIDSALPLPSTIKTAGVSVAQAKSYADARAVMAMPS